MEYWTKKDQPGYTVHLTDAEAISVWIAVRLHLDTSFGDDKQYASEQLLELERKLNEMTERG